MSEATEIRNLLLKKGFFPEVLPPCFDSTDLVRSFSGLFREIKKNQFHQRSSSYIRYNGTKHDGNRRNYGTVNPVPYSNICAFIGNNWELISTKIGSSSLGLSTLSLADKNADRALLIPALSEVTARLSKQIKYSPYVVKADIAQFFPSIYTHSMSWVIHGIEQAKKDTHRNSKEIFFNQLDWFTQQCQNGQTRGVLIGPDAFRLIAEIIACEIDKNLIERAKDQIIGAVRHVDDFYVGIRSEFDASIVLSHLRDTLQDYELQINDSKTKILNGLQPVDDLWAQELRTIRMNNRDVERIHYALDKSFHLSNELGSQSPMKLIVRRLDSEKCYRQDETWQEVEPKLQRILFHHNHCVDYVCLLVVKRIAIKRAIDIESWSSVTDILINRYINSNQQHEIVWLVWLKMICKMQLSPEIVGNLSRVPNSHVKALLIAGFQAGLLATRPNIKLGNKLSSSDENWLHNLIGKASGYTRAPFTGAFSKEFEHLAEKKVKLINFKKHIKAMKDSNSSAISKTKYGYDVEEKDENDDDDNDHDFFLSPDLFDDDDDD